MPEEKTDPRSIRGDRPPHLKRKSLRPCATSAFCRRVSSPGRRRVRRSRTRRAHPARCDVLEKPREDRTCRTPEHHAILKRCERAQDRRAGAEPNCGAATKPAVTTTENLCCRHGSRNPGSYAGRGPGISCCAAGNTCCYGTAPRSHRRCGEGGWPSKPGSRQTLSPPMLALRAHLRLPPTPLTRSPVRRPTRPRLRLVLRTRHRRLPLRRPLLRISVRRR